MRPMRLERLLWSGADIDHVRAMSGILPKADILGDESDARFVPKADIRFPGERAYSGARALRNGISEIIIRPLNGSFSSKIK